MFTPVYLLPQFSAKESTKYRERWNGSDGQRLRDQILEMIRNGAGEDFLQWDFEQGRLGFLEDTWDLKGINIFQEDISFPEGDNFEGIDFAYAEFYHSKFKNAVFREATFNFTGLYDCEFLNCTFLFTTFYGATLEEIKFMGCDFIEHNEMTNCDFRESIFRDCFYASRLFFDCRFDDTTSLDTPVNEPFSVIEGIRLGKSALSGIYDGIKESYAAGHVSKQYRQYSFRQKQCITRHNAETLRDRIEGYFLELVTG